MSSSLLSKFFLLVTANLIIIPLLFVNGDGLIEVFRWKQIDYYNRGGDGVAPNGGGGRLQREPDSIIFPDQLHNRRNKVRNRREVITSRDQPVTTSVRLGDADTPSNASYIPYNNVPMGVTHFKDRLFVTMPRRRLGIPSTLNYIDMRKDGKNPSPKLHAYPDFATNYLDPNLQSPTSGLISVYRTSVDACKRLWFIDTGMLEYPGNRTQVQRPSIWIMDLMSDRVLQRFEIPESVVDTGRGLASITVDADPKRCGQAFAYIPDLVNRQLFVYSLENNRIWGFSHNYFNFDPLGGDLTIGGESFRWDDGIFSATLGPPLENGHHDLYFHAMASNNEFVVSTEVLQDESNAARADHGRDFRLLGSRGTDRQSTMHEFDPMTGVLFYSEIQRNGVGCWNTKKPFTAANHGSVAENAERMIYPSDLTIDEEGTIWVMTNSMPIFIYSTLDTNVFNFHIWKQNVKVAAKNTVCESS